jgi:hypothetical protein
MGDAQLSYHPCTLCTMVDRRTGDCGRLECARYDRWREEHEDDGDIDSDIRDGATCPSNHEQPA